MMRLIWGVPLLVVLTACQTPVPDSGAGGGVGFDSYSDYTLDQARRAGEVVPQPTTPLISNEVISGGGQVPTTTAPQVPAAPAAAAPSAAASNNPGISDEQDFSAVASRETIESDKERLAAQREAYQVIQPSAVPDRPGNIGPSIVDFALNTMNNVGQKIYSRSGLFAANRFNRNCAKYASADLAQEAFLKSGGPERDRMGLDPDGDGFACYWDPAPFRLARGN